MSQTNPTDFLRKLLASGKSLMTINEILERKTGVQDFLSTIEDLHEFQQVFDAHAGSEATVADLGDFQTPSPLTDRICRKLASLGQSPTILLEPTAGTGNFIFSAMEWFPNLQYIYAIELQKKYEWLFKLKCVYFFAHRPASVKIQFHRDNIFTHAFAPEFLGLVKRPESNLMIVGNPPWITNTELSTLGSINLPTKTNIKKNKGFDALTGKSNFDIAESILLRLVGEFSSVHGSLAMLLKTSVIRNLVRDAPKLSFHMGKPQALVFDAKKEFAIDANAALFLAEFGRSDGTTCRINGLEDPAATAKTFGYSGRFFVSDIDLYARQRQLEGTFPVTWRQGIKHDAKKVMVLKQDIGTTLLNSLDENVAVEGDYLYPHVTGTQLQHHWVIQETPLRVIVPQKKIGEETAPLRIVAPRLWQYLTAHGDLLNARKSSIYKNKPRFSIFGVGSYSFKPYKVGLSGFHKHPHFCLVLPVDQRPVMLDDTSYFLSFEQFPHAFYTWVFLNQPAIGEFLSAIAFPDDKRPYTKDVLMRVNFTRIVAEAHYPEVREFYATHLAQYFHVDPTPEEFQAFQEFIAQQRKSTCLKKRRENGTREIEQKR